MIGMKLVVTFFWSMSNLDKPLLSIVGSRYCTIPYNTTFYATRQNLAKHIAKRRSLNSQNTHQILPSRTRYGISNVCFFAKNWPCYKRTTHYEEQVCVSDVTTSEKQKQKCAGGHFIAWHTILWRFLVITGSHLSAMASENNGNSNFVQELAQANNKEGTKNPHSSLLSGVSSGRMWYPHTKGQ